MTAPHDRIIADAARRSLTPIGFRRKGRSRMWLTDQKWWATVVEFQPSRWSKGCYLNVAAHWLWSTESNVSFDFGGRVEEHVDYVSDVQFTEALARLAETAALESDKLVKLFPSISEAALVLLDEERANSGNRRGGWMAYHAGITLALSGNTEAAQEMFVRVAKGFAPPESVLAQSARRMARLARATEDFQRQVSSLIERHRAALRLPTLSITPF